MATAPAAAPTSHRTGAPATSYTPALIVLTSLFFIWGAITSLNDILIPHLKGVFDLNYTQAMLIQFTFFMAYFLVSLPSGLIVDRVGYKRGIILGLVTAGIGCLLFYPAAGTRSYPIFLAALFVLASGITLLQVSANPYVAILGPPETASSRLNLTQAFNSLGTTVAPFVGAILILGVAAHTAEEMAALAPAEREAYRLAEAAAVQVPYLWLAAILFGIAAVIAAVRLPAVEAGSIETAGTQTGAALAEPSAWHYRHLVLGAVAIFLYVGAEVSIGSFLVNFMAQPEIGNLPETQAGRYLSFYWGGAMVGRFIGAFVLQKVDPGKALAFNAAVAALLVAAAMAFSGPVAMWSLLAVGLFNSIMFPTIFTLGVAGLGHHTGQGSGILCMAIVGGAILPLVQGYFADAIGLHHAFFIPVLCYLYIMYYGWSGHIPRRAAVALP